MPTSEKRRKLLVLKGYRFSLSNLLILTCYQKTRGRALVYMRSHPVNNVGEHKGEKCRPIMKPLCYIVILCALCRDIGHPTVPSIKFNFRFPNLHGSAQFTLLQWNSNTRVFARRPGHFQSHLVFPIFTGLRRKSQLARDYCSNLIFCNQLALPARKARYSMITIGSQYCLKLFSLFLPKYPNYC